MAGSSNARGGAVLVAGTASDAGKSVVCAGLCRAFARAGLRVAPFKAQNMSLNSAVTPQGEEIGRAQAAQAAAAGARPEAAMNPVLLKPSGEQTSQVVVLGRPYRETSAAEYRALTRELRPIVHEALEDLRARFDLVVCEGAGGLAEVNLRDSDLANMGLAREADLPVLVVGDIDRGGVFASLYGSLALLDAADQRLVSGFIINKFRGDAALLRPGIERLTELTGRGTLGVLPWLDGLSFDAEDSLALDVPHAELAPVGRDVLDVAVVRLRWISNFTDVDALAAEPGVAVRFTRSAAAVRAADLVVVPGTKATVRDLRLLAENGLDAALRERASAGAPVLGLCGGYQMLGRRIVDDVESGTGEVGALDLLPVETRFDPQKTLATPRGRAPAFGDAAVSGFEIHHGVVERTGGEPLFITEAGDEGCVSGAVLATSWHGALECDAFRRALLSWVAEARRVDWEPGTRAFADVREERLDRLGDLVERHLDLSAVHGLATQGPPEALPLLPPGAA